MIFNMAGKGGGVALPHPIQAGEVVAAQDTTKYSSSVGAYVNIGNTITIKKAGTYRFRYNCLSDGNPRVQITKNGAAVPSSEANGTKTMDVECSANDVFIRQIRQYDTYYRAYTTLFQASILWPEVTEKLSELV